ncbi:MAG: hypothetical protein OER96_07345 [Gammaproteobacteria bacterium]|nr:hypothetical protein [Gammaproteobacteria bacterium]
MGASLNAIDGVILITAIAKNENAEVDCYTASTEPGVDKSEKKESKKPVIKTIE